MNELYSFIIVALSGLGILNIFILLLIIKMGTKWETIIEVMQNNKDDNGIKFRGIKDYMDFKKLCADTDTILKNQMSARRNPKQKINRSHSRIYHFYRLKCLKDTLKNNKPNPKQACNFVKNRRTPTP